MSVKLHYFHLSGLAEFIRYMLHYNGQNFEDIRHESEKWPIKEVKDSLPYGQLPLYEEGNRKLNQSLAIARYVASKSDLLPSDPWEQAVLDAAVFNIYDFRAKVRAYVTEADAVKKEQMKVQLFGETIDYYLSRFEKELKANNGFFGRKLSWADFVLVGIIETLNIFLGQNIEKDYPTIVTLANNIRALPGVKEYIATRTPYEPLKILKS